MDEPTEMIRDSIVRQLRDYRLQEHITQRYLAEKIGISPASLSAYETGAKTPPLDIALKIAQALVISLDELVGNTGDPPSYPVSNYGTMIGYLEYLLEPAQLLDICEDAEGVLLRIKDKEAIEILKGWKKVLKLHRDKIIDDEMYAAWIHMKMQEYGTKVIPGLEELNHILGYDELENGNKS